MKIIFGLIFFIFMSAITIPVFASEPENVANSFTDLMISGDMQKAIDIYMHPKFRKMIGVQLNASLVQIESYSKAFGGFEEKEILHNEELSSRLRRIVYIIHTPITPISFEIFVYKNNNKWKITSFSFDTDMDEIFPVKPNECRINGIRVN